MPVPCAIFMRLAMRRARRCYWSMNGHRSHDVILREYKYYRHSCSDISKRIYFECSLEEEVPDLVFVCSRGCIYLSSFILEKMACPPLLAFYLGKKALL